MPKFRSLPMTGLLLVTGLLMASPNASAVAEEVSHASEIVQYVREDKVYLLENIRSQITKPSEKLVVQALLTEDGPRAAALYREQLDRYPDPRIDPISRDRLKAYEQAVATSAGLPVMPLKGSAAAPRPVVTVENLPAQPAANPAKWSDTTIVAPPALPQTQQAGALEPGGPFTLQFGSFDSITNADQLVAQLSPSAASSVQLINGVYKVRLTRTFNSRQDASAFGRSLPIESIVVPAKP